MIREIYFFIHLLSFTAFAQKLADRGTSFSGKPTTTFSNGIGDTIRPENDLPTTETNPNEIFTGIEITTKDDTFQNNNSLTTAASSEISIKLVNESRAQPRAAGEGRQLPAERGGPLGVLDPGTAFRLNETSNLVKRQNSSESLNFGQKNSGEKHESTQIISLETKRLENHNLASDESPSKSTVRFPISVLSGRIEKVTQTERIESTTTQKNEVLPAKRKNGENEENVEDEDESPSQGQFHILTGIPPEISSETQKFADGQNNFTTKVLNNVETEKSSLSSQTRIFGDITPLNGSPKGAQDSSTNTAGHVNDQSPSSRSFDATSNAQVTANAAKPIGSKFEEPPETPQPSNVHSRAKITSKSIPLGKSSSEKFQDRVHDKFITLICNMLALCIYDEVEVKDQLKLTNVSNTFADFIEADLQVKLGGDIPPTDVDQSIFLDEMIEKTIQYFKKANHWTGECKVDKHQLAKIAGCESTFSNSADVNSTAEAEQEGESEDESVILKPNKQSNAANERGRVSANPDRSRESAKAVSTLQVVPHSRTSQENADAGTEDTAPPKSATRGQSTLPPLIVAVISTTKNPHAAEPSKPKQSKGPPGADDADEEDEDHIVGAIGTAAVSHSIGPQLPGDPSMKTVGGEASTSNIIGFFGLTTTIKPERPNIDEQGSVDTKNIELPKAKKVDNEVDPDVIKTLFITRGPLTLQSDTGKFRAPDPAAASSPIFKLKNKTSHEVELQTSFPLENQPQSGQTSSAEVTKTRFFQTSPRILTKQSTGNENSHENKLGTDLTFVRSSTTEKASTAGRETDNKVTTILPPGFESRNAETEFESAVPTRQQTPIAQKLPKVDIGVSTDEKEEKNDNENTTPDPLLSQITKTVTAGSLPEAESSKNSFTMLLTTAGPIGTPLATQETLFEPKFSTEKSQTQFNTSTSRVDSSEKSISTEIERENKLTTLPIITKNEPAVPGLKNLAPEPERTTAHATKPSAEPEPSPKSEPAPTMSHQTPEEGQFSDDRSGTSPATQISAEFTDLDWSLRFTGVEWKESLKDNTSMIFKELKNQIEPELTRIFEDLLKDKFIQLTMKKFSKGSVVAQGRISLLNEKLPDAVELMKEFQNSVKKRNYKINSLDVDPSGIRIQKPGTDAFLEKESKDVQNVAPEPVPSTGSGFPGYAIGIIVGLVILAIAILAGIFYMKRFHNRHSEYIENGTSSGDKAVRRQVYGQRPYQPHQPQPYAGPAAYEMSGSSPGTPSGQAGTTATAAYANQAYQRDPQRLNGQGRTPHSNPSSKV